MYRTYIKTEMSFFCLSAVKCPALLTPLNGTRQGCTGTTMEYYNTVCLFSCNAGFNAFGSLSRKCLENGNWSGQDFICQGDCHQSRSLGRGIFQNSQCRTADVELINSGAPNDRLHSNAFKLCFRLSEVLRALLGLF